MEDSDKWIEACETETAKRVLPHRDQVSKLTTIPGVSDLSAIIIISEIGLNMNPFSSDKQLRYRAGLSFANYESAGQKICQD